ncbi:ArsR/SmtB family transcription factor [Actinomadura verrucosospora]|uniref:ArsR family transcriptional regulator n=1 Tax=Actinomadura verrucosospora TaxID=46165 RepID=A0A7D3VUA7_ACTVE|nr:metalloregulator ArsR/SmtB family transcription factor [Actinomadura verrucosospora]QKG23495.1 ArsR family transcriptional regulator [Actinomadura verrucosospora]
MSRPQASEDPFRAISDPTRRRIIELLHERPRTAGEIAASFTTCQSTVSEHLGILRRAGLVRFTERAGRRTYTLAPEPLVQVADWAGRHSPQSTPLPP